LPPGVLQAYPKAGRRGLGPAPASTGRSKDQIDGIDTNQTGATFYHLHLLYNQHYEAQAGLVDAPTLRAAWQTAWKIPNKDVFTPWPRDVTHRST
jgi:hypothetical protein